MRWLCALFGLVGATAFALSVQVGMWWTVPDVLDIGPRTQCFKASECIPTGMSWVRGSAQWERLGIATWAAGLVAAFVLVLLGATVAAGRVPKLIAKMTLVAMATALAASTAFVAKFPGVEGASLDRGAVLYIAGMVFGATAAIATLRRA